MKIQVISYENNWANKFEGYEIIYSTIHEPRSFDEFDINIISLQDSRMWRYSGDSPITIEKVEDLISIKEIINNSKKSTTIVCYPKNNSFSYNYHYNQRNTKTKELKDIIDNVETIVQKMLPNNMEKHFHLSYENTTTILGQNDYNAAFHFTKISDYIKTRTKSLRSNKRTTICYNDLLYFTTLDLTNHKSGLKDFLMAVGLDGCNIQIPQWLLDLNCFDDVECKNAISEKQAQIDILNDQISKEQKKLQENAKYKRVLVESGDPLVEIVFNMLEKMLDYDLSKFVDEKKQDFLIRKETITFIGEIKGISSNVSYENVSQLERHYGSYLDELEKSGNTENVKMILIINPFRTKPLGDREPVHINQIKLAQKYGSLIITTEVLLALFEKFLNNSVSKEKIFDLLINKVGILEKNDF